MQNNLGSLLLIKIAMLSFQSQQFKIDVQKKYLMCLKKNIIIFFKLHHKSHLLGTMTSFLIKKKIFF